MAVRFSIFCIFVMACIAGSLAITCVDPRPFVNRWVIGVDNKECVALIKEKCSGMKQYTTHKWRKGLQVKTNCNKIPKWTAIATFLGSGGSYKGHAAIFESCANDGIWVYDQWNTANVQKRKIRYNNPGKPNYDGNNFYTIVI